MAGADLRAALAASCFRGAFPPVDFRAVCLVRAIFVIFEIWEDREKVVGWGLVAQVLMGGEQ